jgi:tRNA 2-thiocytidine biosynthesis protein TtcA
VNKNKHDALYGSDIAWRVSRKVGRAIGQFKLLENGDHVLCAISGGKDSLTMLDQLARWQEKLPFSVRLSAVHVKTDFHCGGCVHNRVLGQFFDERRVPGHLLYTEVVKTAPNGKMSCFHCARRRRIALFRLANDLGANKIALGHHLDDIVETTLMNMCFNGTFSTMLPRMDLFEGRTAIIRPLALCLEREVVAYADDRGFQRQLCRCPFGHDSMRARMKTLVKQLEGLYPDVRQNIFASQFNLGASPEI